jgi:CIC family chloride channel protein
VLFAVELMLNEVSVRTLVPVTIATVTATYIGQMAFGPHPAFVIPALESAYFHVASPVSLLAYACLGVLTGAVSALFITFLYAAESAFLRRIDGSYYRQHLAGMLLVGLMIYSLMVLVGHYYVEGVGYSTIQDILSGSLMNVFLLVCLWPRRRWPARRFGCKLLATCLTLGSGASGGVFSPALFMGCTTGGAYLMFLNHLFPGLGISPAAFAVAGMAGVVGGSTAAAITSIVMIFEMTLDYSVIVPMTLTVAISYAIRRAMVSESIYTRKLTLRGHRVPEALHANAPFIRGTNDLMDSRFKTVPAEARVATLMGRAASADDAKWYIVEDQGRIMGLIPKEQCEETIGKPDAKLGDVARRDFLTVLKDTPLNRLCTLMWQKDATFALVRSNGQPTVHEIKGIITRLRLADAVVEGVKAIRRRVVNSNVSLSESQ